LLRKPPRGIDNPRRKSLTHRHCALTTTTFPDHEARRPAIGGAGWFRDPEDFSSSGRHEVFRIMGFCVRGVLRGAGWLLAR
ncbi:hypothetical protein, partial [Dactylosporangium sp. NPDC005555]|uniref:hypothetical protein n=1 Tax=Dactylosporangium sp. NPDC005555 TaxID=3154889 RepID=UPI0033A3276F